MFVKVAIDLALDRLFTYEVPVALHCEIRVGQLLRVPFGHREARGFALAISETAESGIKVKPISGIADPAPFFSEKMLQLVKWIAAYTCSPIELCLKTALPAAVLKEGARARELLFVAPSFNGTGELTARQRELFDDIVRVGGGWMGQLCKEFKTSQSVIRALGEKGYLTVKARERRRDPLSGRNIMPSKPLPLNAMQSAALKAISEADRPVLLHGVTGSGKTEVYLQAIAGEIAAGRGAIVMVPEISLTPQTVRRFAGRFGSKVAVLHSALSNGERYDEWHRIRTGEARVVVGPRSAIFAPVVNLGLIVVDEEHDTSYKQDETPRYNARDLAVVRGKLEGAKVVLGSATPSLETYLNAKNGKYARAVMAERVAGRQMPDVKIVNLQEEAATYSAMPIFSKFLLDAVAERLRRGEQTILFLNRRGYSRIMECVQCGYVPKCPDCSMNYTYHLADRCLRCHICGGWARLPARCPECGGRDFRNTGVGTQRAEAALVKMFPSARILRMDADSTARKNSHDDILAKFRAREADILIGTQMIAKGLDFPNVTLVGVLNADIALNLPDFRASERAFQLIAQVSGRAGRADKPGEVFIQTSDPDSDVIRMAADADFDGFAAMELAVREECGLPPYAKFATVTVKAKDERLARDWAQMYAAALKRYPGLKVSDAVPPGIEKAEGWYRQQVQIRSPTADRIARAWKWIASARPVPNGVRAAIDIDAINVM